MIMHVMGGRGEREGGEGTKRAIFGSVNSFEGSYGGLHQI